MRSWIPFENPCRLENPPRLETFWRRAVYELAVHRLNEIVEAIRGFDTQHTGKVYRDEFGDAIGRGKGILPSLKKEFRELQWEQSPAALVNTITRHNTPAYFRLLERSIEAVDAESGEALEAFIKSAPRGQLTELAPVVYPAHKGNKRCRHCRRPHSSTLHRFHLRGSFDRTHGRPAAGRRRFRDEVPF